jgi:hypothetical protein
MIPAKNRSDRLSPYAAPLAARAIVAGPGLASSAEAVIRKENSEDVIKLIGET